MGTSGWFIYGDDGDYRVADRTRLTPDGVIPSPDEDPYPSATVDSVIETVLFRLEMELEDGSRVTVADVTALVAVASVLRVGSMIARASTIGD